MTEPAARDVLAEAHPVYPGGPPCNPYCPGEWSMYHDGYADGYENGESAALSPQPEAAGEAGLRAALDVERLAEAEYNVDQGNQFNVMADALDWAKEVAAEYDRLAAPALPE